MADDPGFADEVRALYHGPLADFTAARKALAKRLRKAGDARAAEAAELRKPSLSAWAVGQLFAHEARAMAAFASAGDRARASQSRAASGDPAALRAALATIRDETPRLLARAVELLAAAERAPGEAIVERIRTDLEALALDPSTAPIAQRGWLDEDLPPPGFEVMASLQLAAAGTRPAPAPRGAAAAAAPSRPSRRASAASAPPAAPARPLATVTRMADARGAAVKRRAAAEREAIEGRERRERERQGRERGERIARLRAEAADAERVATERRAEAEQTATEAERAAKEAETAQRRAAEAQARAREARQIAIAADAVARRALTALERAERG